MLLRPRKINYKNSHKKRSYKKLKSKLPLNSKLIYGQFGLKNLNPNFILYNKHLFKLKIFLKKSVRRSNITNRYLWVNIFPHIPVTKKVIGSRMGKGKGKLSNWAAKILPGSIFIEFRNVRPGRAEYFMSQVDFKWPGNFKIISKYRDYTQLISFKKKTIQQSYHF